MKKILALCEQVYLLKVGWRTTTKLNEHRLCPSFYRSSGDILNFSRNNFFCKNVGKTSLVLQRMFIRYVLRRNCGAFQEGFFDFNKLQSGLVVTPIIAVILLLKSHHTLHKKQKKKKRNIFIQKIYIPYCMQTSIPADMFFGIRAHNKI